MSVPTTGKKRLQTFFVGIYVYKCYLKKKPVSYIGSKSLNVLVNVV